MDSFSKKSTQRYNHNFWDTMMPVDIGAEPISAPISAESPTEKKVNRSKELKKQGAAEGDIDFTKDILVPRYEPKMDIIKSDSGDTDGDAKMRSDNYAISTDQRLLSNFDAFAEAIGLYRNHNEITGTPHKSVEPLSPTNEISFSQSNHLKPITQTAETVCVCTQSSPSRLGEGLNEVMAKNRSQCNQTVLQLKPATQTAETVCTQSNQLPELDQARTETSSKSNIVGWFSVDKIVKCRTKKKKKEYLVQWEGYTSEENSWVAGVDVTTDLKKLFHQEAALAKKERKKKPRVMKKPDFDPLISEEGEEPLKPNVLNKTSVSSLYGCGEQG